MRFTFLLAFCFTLSLLQAQTAATSQRASLGLQVASGQFGGFGEIFIRPNISAWGSFGFSQSDGQLGFGEDTISGSSFFVPEETLFFDEIQREIIVRAGVRFYIPTIKEKWQIWYSPILGYRNRTAPTEEYAQAFQREDLHFLSEITGRLRAERELQLGGEVGTRWMFWRKPEASSGLYLEGSLSILGKRSLLDNVSTEGRANLGIRAAFGISF